MTVIILNFQPKKSSETPIKEGISIQNITSTDCKSTSNDFVTFFQVAKSLPSLTISIFPIGQPPFTLKKTSPFFIMLIPV